MGASSVFVQVDMSETALLDLLKFDSCDSTAKLLAWHLKGMPGFRKIAAREALVLDIPKLKYDNMSLLDFQ